ncbi:MAG: B12-binding domain-containing protein [Clostridium fessum]
MIPALDKVGKGFEAGTVFLPQLLMSAEAAKSAFEVIKNQMESSGKQERRRTRSCWRPSRAIFMTLEKIS